MSDDHQPIEQADTAAAPDPRAELGSAKTAIDVPDRSPSQKALHEDVKKALFSDDPPARPETGKVFAGRYRIEQKLGQGGMGEVFRARDLVLEENVAIKLLPRTLAARPGYYERFVQEVRLARQVSHPSICRVHDIGEMDGQPFISMEYVDGEDLSTLLRRIGRLGQEKAVELAHQLCSGLEALHDKGIIHRDLKPSNIMLDGDGRIRIADFGLASVADELREHEIRDGTPAYQAPEQKEGREATVRSDVYALGLVLREMFVGRGPGRSRSDAATATATVTSETAIDAAITETIDRCLEEDPAKRPATALAVSAALPGGDPLAAALAAGRMPSPEAVANAATVGGLRSVQGTTLLFVVLALLAIFAGARGQRTSLGYSGDLLPPSMLETKALDVLAALGEDTDSLAAKTLDYDGNFALELDRSEQEDFAAPLRDFSVFRYEYRIFGVFDDLGATEIEELPVAYPGDASVVLDGQGRLVGLTRIPEPHESSEEDDSSESEESERLNGLGPWEYLLARAELDSAGLKPGEPASVPPVYADEVKAWTGSRGDTSLQVDAATLNGSPVWFSVQRSDTVVAGALTATGARGLAFLVMVAVFVIVAIGALGSMVSALRQAGSAEARKEWDHRGARTLAVVVFLAQVVAWVLDARGPELFLIGWFVLEFAGSAVLTWLAYLVLEPYARAHWPRTLVSWNRLLQGRFRDPMVGRDAMIGAAAGLAFILLFFVDGREFSSFGTSALLSPLAALATIPQSLSRALGYTLVLFLALISLQRIVRRRAIAVIIFLSFVPSMVLLVQGSMEMLVVSAAAGAGAAFIMLRYGVLAMVFTVFAAMVCGSLPVATGLESAWWSGAGLLGTAIVAAMAIGGYRLSTAPQRSAATG